MTPSIKLILTRVPSQQETCSDPQEGRNLFINVPKSSKGSSEGHDCIVSCLHPLVQVFLTHVEDPEEPKKGLVLNAIEEL